MENFRIAVKAFIINDDQFLIMKRSENATNKPEGWDIPGGRLEIGENSFDGIKREVREEADIDIEILMPLDIQHFVRDDGQQITMIMFLCKALSKKIKLSDEHTEYKWIDIHSDKELIPQWLWTPVDNLFKYKIEYDQRVTT